MMAYRPLVYVSGRFQNNPRNQKKIEKCIIDLLKIEEDILYFSPVNTWGFLYEIEDYDLSLSKCLQMLSLASAMVIIKEGHEESVGVQAEMEYCKKHNIPMYFYTNGNVEKI